MNRFLLILFSIIPFLGCKAQAPENRPKLNETSFDEKLGSLLSFSVPLIGVEEVHKAKENYILLDTREREEFEVSHIPGATFVGYKDFESSSVENLDRDKPVVLYCSVGYRSEKIGEKLRKMGFSKVYNLYGSIFEWVNKGYPIVTPMGVETKKIHTYNKKWSEWMTNPSFQKIW
ncbi:MAG: rhodanese-like domain-containing protein [Bacteroidetes bacterium]|nr:rhodanese-like domain-containing protein [Bacteroidota bacterium]